MRLISYSGIDSIISSNHIRFAFLAVCFCFQFSCLAGETVPTYVFVPEGSENGVQHRAHWQLAEPIKVYTVDEINSRISGLKDFENEIVEQSTKAAIAQKSDVEKRLKQEIDNSEARLKEEVLKSIEKLPERLLSDGAKRAIAEAVKENLKEQVERLKSDLQSHIDQLKRK